MSPPCLEVRGLNVWIDVPGRQQVHPVRGVDFSVERGERFGLVGESGSGKTTTALAIMGLLPSNASLAGEVVIDGESLLVDGEKSVRPHRWTDIAMVFQGAMNAFNPVLTIGRQITEALEFHGVAHGSRARARTVELLEMVDVRPTVANSYPHELSGGMRQRAMIAMALSCEPRILLADEPTTALDVVVQAQILELLTDLCDERGLTLLLITHDLAVVARVCQRAAVMRDGEFLEIGTLETLYHNAQHPYTRELFSSTPRLVAARGRRHGAAATTETLPEISHGPS
jgi:ABC-type dipeptide/oligopeptide/nickel transport system ATPase component